MTCRSILCGVWGLLVAMPITLASEPPAPKAPPVADDPQREKLPTPAELEEFARNSRTLALASKVPFVNPPEIHSGQGLLQTSLVVTYGHNRIGNDRVHLRSYQGYLVGPTFRVHPNDRLHIRLVNNLPAEPEAPAVHDINAAPHGANTTNLHIHGLHVSPEDNSDNPFLEVPPGGRQDYDIRLGSSNRPGLAIPAHPPGTHWYHPHKHGGAAIQLASGMTGSLIVEGGLDDVPEIKAARERIFVFQQCPYSRDTPGVLEGKKGFLNVRDWTRFTNRFTTINGLLKPVIEMAPGEVERWRLIHSALSVRLNLGVKPVAEGKPRLDLHEIAIDGIALGRIERQSQIDLTTGGTSDALFKAPDEPGEYLLFKTSERVQLSPDPKDVIETPEDIVARIVVRGPKNPMALPDSKSLAGLAPYRDIGEVQKHRALTLNGVGGKVPRWNINEKLFDPDKTDLCPVLGTAEEWTVKSLNQSHPFHIHVNAFQVLSIKDDTGREKVKTPGIWRDTVVLDQGDTLRFRIRFEDFPGKTVLHCHKLDHEDLGMMHMVRILPEAPQEREKDAKEPPAKAAPAWRLPDAAGTMHELKEFAGRRVVLVFFRGMGCLHCVEQLKALTDRRKALEDAGIVVVAIGSEPLKPGKTSDWPFPILADGSHEIFKQYSCYERQPMHGVFAIDGRGQIRWSKLSETPFADIDKILEVAGRLPTE